MSIAPPKTSQEATASEAKAYADETTLRHGLGNPYTLKEWAEAIKRATETGQFNFDETVFASSEKAIDLEESAGYHAEIQLPDHMVSSVEIIQKLRKIQEASKKRSEKSTHRRHEEEKTFESVTSGPGR